MNTGTALPAPCHSQRPDTASPHESSPRSPCRCPARKKQTVQDTSERFRHPALTFTHRINAPHLHLERPPLYLGDALGDDEGDAVTGTAGYLREVPAEQLQTALQLLMAALDGQSLQTALVTRQETLRRPEEKVLTT